MKRSIAILLAGLLLLSGCAQPEPQPVFDPAPILSQEGVTIGGRPLSGVYTAGGTRYWDLQEFAAVLGGSVEVHSGIETHSATFALEGKEKTFATGPEGGLYTGTAWYQPEEDLLALLEGYHPYKVEGRTYYTAYPLAEEIPEGYEVPTLMYHAVSDDCWGIAQLFVSPSELEKQLQWLQEEGYTTIHFEDLGRVDEIQKPILLTFDDGYLDNYTELFPLLKKYNAKATVFMIMGSVGGWNYLTADQIKEMDASGLVSFQSHTVTHEFLSTRTAEQLEYELSESKRMLAEITGKESFVLCYPTGKYSEESLDATADHYQFGLLMSGKNYETGDNPLKITRRYIARSTTLEQYKDMIG